jgi:hypothetical protein
MTEGVPSHALTNLIIALWLRRPAALEEHFLRDLRYAAKSIHHVASKPAAKAWLLEDR